MTMLRTAGITLAFFFASAHARADEISDEQAACQGNDVGKTCTLGGIPGTCENSKCSRIDYSGDKPKSVERDCVVCKPTGATKAAEPTKAEPVPAKTEPAPAKAEPAPAKEEPVPANTETPAKADAPVSKAAAKSEAPAKAEAAPAKSGCAVEPGPLSLGTIPLGIVLVALARRRRR